jgi:hypothetical protein
MNRVTRRSPQGCGQPGYSQGKTNASAVVASYRHAAAAALRHTEKRRLPLPCAVIAGLGAGLGARGSGYPRTPPKGERALRVTDHRLKLLAEQPHFPPASRARDWHREPAALEVLGRLNRLRQIERKPESPLANLARYE